MVTLEEALRALGFGKKGKGKPACAEPIRKEGSDGGSSRKKTEGEKSAAGLNDHAASFQSPIAHGARDESYEAVWLGLDDRDPLSRLLSWEIDSLLFAEASALARRFPDVGEWELVRRSNPLSGPAGRLRRS